MTHNSPDVSALVLTIGETTTQRAIDSISTQTLKPAEVVIVRDVRPWHNAMNAGAARVATPFFVLVDSDMVLDPDCFEQLRKRMRPGIAAVVAALRDPLMGSAIGVKLFRTECFKQVSVPDSIAPDTDFNQLVRARGWKTIRARRGLQMWRGEVLALGEHSPTYTPEYTYRKHLMEGRRYHYRQSLPGIRWDFAMLEGSRHPSALIAQIGLAHGIFLGSSQDLLGREELPGDRYPDLERFFAHPEETAVTGSLPPLPKTTAQVYASYFLLGRSLFEEGTPKAFERIVRALGNTRGDDAAWIAKIGLFRGLADRDYLATRPENDFRMLEEFLATKDPESPPLLRLVEPFSQSIRQWRGARKRKRQAG